MTANHPAFYAENNAHATKRHAAALRKQAEALIDLADELDIAANLGIHYSLEAQGKPSGPIPPGRHNALKCKNADHDDCLRAQLAVGNPEKSAGGS